MLYDILPVSGRRRLERTGSRRRSRPRYRCRCRSGGRPSLLSCRVCCRWYLATDEPPASRSDGVEKDSGSGREYGANRGLFVWFFFFNFPPWFSFRKSFTQSLHGVPPVRAVLWLRVQTSPCGFADGDGGGARERRATSATAMISAGPCDGGGLGVHGGWPDISEGARNDGARIYTRGATCVPVRARLRLPHDPPRRDHGNTVRRRCRLTPTLYHPASPRSVARILSRALRDIARVDKRDKKKINISIRRCGRRINYARQ